MDVTSRRMLPMQTRPSSLPLKHGELYMKRGFAAEPVGGLTGIRIYAPFWWIYGEM